MDQNSENKAEERRLKLLALLEEEIWPQIPAELRGTRLTKEEVEEILGYGKLGV